MFSGLGTFDLNTTFAQLTSLSLDTLQTGVQSGALVEDAVKSEEKSIEHPCSEARPVASETPPACENESSATVAETSSTIKTLNPVSVGQCVGVQVGVQVEFPAQEIARAVFVDQEVQSDDVSTEVDWSAERQSLLSEIQQLASNVTQLSEERSHMALAQTTQQTTYANAEALWTKERSTLVADCQSAQSAMAAAQSQLQSVVADKENLQNDVVQQRATIDTMTEKLRELMHKHQDLRQRSVRDQLLQEQRQEQRQDEQQERDQLRENVKHLQSQLQQVQQALHHSQQQAQSERDGAVQHVQQLEQQWRLREQALKDAHTALETQMSQSAGNLEEVAQNLEKERKQREQYQRTAAAALQKAHRQTQVVQQELAVERDIVAGLQAQLTESRRATETAAAELARAQDAARQRELDFEQVRKEHEALASVRAEARVQVRRRDDGVQTEDTASSVASDDDHDLSLPQSHTHTQTLGSRAESLSSFDVVSASAPPVLSLASSEAEALEDAASGSQTPQIPQMTQTAGLVLVSELQQQVAQLQGELQRRAREHDDLASQLRLARHKAQEQEARLQELSRLQRAPTESSAVEEEYLRVCVVRYLSSTSSSERLRLLPVLTALLQCSAREGQRLQEVQQQLLQRDESVTGSAASAVDSALSWLGVSLSGSSASSGGGKSS